MAKRYLIVRCLDNSSELYRLDVSGRSEHIVEKVERGLLLRVDTERFFVDDTDVNPLDEWT